MSDGVREAAARAVAERLGFTYPGSDAGWVFDAAADAALAALADHPGLVDVLRGHLRSKPAICPCGWVGAFWGDWDGEYAAHLADVVRAWLRGE